MWLLFRCSLVVNNFKCLRQCQTDVLGLLLKVKMKRTGLTVETIRLLSLPVVSIWYQTTNLKHWLVHFSDNRPSPYLVLTLVDVDIILVWLGSAYLDSNHFIVVAVTIVDYSNYLVQSMTYKDLLNNKTSNSKQNNNTLTVNKKTKYTTITIYYVPRFEIVECYFPKVIECS